MSSGLDENQLDGPEIVSGQLNDIKGYWNHSAQWNSDGTDYGYQCNWDFNETNIWEGQFILYKDGWFEGIVIDQNSSYTADRFIFGAYFPDMTIELLKVTPSEVNSPFIFRGKRDAKGYDGQFAVIGLFGEELYGNNHITTRKSEKQDTTELEARINAWKQSMIGDENSFLYENTVRMRNQMLEVIKRNYEGRSFSKDEITEIKEVTDPIAEDVVKETANHVKKMVRKYKAQPISEDDLPF